MGGCCCLEKEKKNDYKMHSITKNLDKIIYNDYDINSEQTIVNDIGSSESEPEPENDK